MKNGRTWKVPKLTQQRRGPPVGSTTLIVPAAPVVQWSPRTSGVQWPRQFIGSVAPWFPVVSGGSLVSVVRLWCGAVAQVCSVWSSGSMDLPTPSNFVMFGMAQGNAPASSAAPISCKMVKWTQPLLGAASPPNSSSAVEPPTPWIKCSGTELHTNFRRPREVRRNGRPTTHGVVLGCALVCWRLMVQ